MSVNNNWYIQDQFPTEVDTEEVLFTVMSHWSRISTVIHGVCDVLMHSGIYESSEDAIKALKIIVANANEYDESVAKVRDYLDRRNNSE